MNDDVQANSEPGASRVLLVDDEPDQAALLRAMLSPLGIEVLTADSAEQAIAALHRQPVDVVVTELHLPGASGIDLIRDLRRADSPPSVVLITGEGSVSSAVEALKLGASDYLQKPIDPVRLVTLVKELLHSDDVREAGENEHLPSRPLVFEGMVGGSIRMREVFSRIERVAPTGAPVLIVGESGTGKELVARALHSRSRRAQGPFVPIHTGAIPKELVASELFGHEKGAFTGALNSTDGKFEAAAGGTVFLDEVGTMELSTQISLLRVLETYRFTRIGASKERDADVRIVAATNRDLLDLVEANQFREDLYYRLNVFTIALPPLRDRPEDILPIAERFLRFFAKRYGTLARCLSDMATERLLAYKWPGNVRELRNVMEQTAVFAQREVVHVDEIQFVSTRLPGYRAPRPTSPNAALAPSTASRDARMGDAAFYRETVPWSDMPPPVGIDVQAGSSHHGGFAQASPPAGGAAGGVVAPPGRDDGALPEPRRAMGSTPDMADAGADDGYTPVPPSHEQERSALSRTPPTPPVDQEHPMILRIPVGTPLAEAERMLIIKTLEVSEGNKQRAARILGISRRGLYTKLAAYGEHIPAEDQTDAGSVPEVRSSEA